MIFDRLFSDDFRRRRLLAKAPAGPLRDYLSTPFPPLHQPASGAAYLALDLETTGGNPATDEIVSFGWVCMAGGRIDLASARHRVVHLQGAMSSGSAVIHGITDDECAQGGSLESALAELLSVLAGRVLIAHRAETELGFVGHACARIYGGRILIPAIDTLQIAIRRAQRKQQALQRGTLRLPALRSHYNLPRYPLHNALTDALSAAELFLAQQAEAMADAPLKDWLFRQ